MKIRLDYVSNSSSSSFMLVGSCYEQEDLLNAFKKHGFDFFKNLSEEEKREIQDDEDTISEYEWDVFYDYVDEWLEKFGLEFHQGIENYSEDEYCVGLRYNAMKMDETRAQFEQRIKESLEKLMGSPQTVECMVDGGQEC